MQLIKCWLRPTVITSKKRNGTANIENLQFTESLATNTIVFRFILGMIAILLIKACMKTVAKSYGFPNGVKLKFRIS